MPFLQSCGRHSSVSYDNGDASDNLHSPTCSSNHLLSIACTSLSEEVWLEQRVPVGGLWEDRLDRMVRSSKARPLKSQVPV